MKDLDKAKLQEHLERLGKSIIEPKNNKYGLCNEIYYFLQEEGIPYKDLTFYEFFPQWGKFSGSLEYPIAHRLYSPTDAFHYIDNLWDDSEYGNDRRELCLFIAENLK